MEKRFNSGLLGNYEKSSYCICIRFSVGPAFGGSLLDAASDPVDWKSDRKVEAMEPAGTK